MSEYREALQRVIRAIELRREKYVDGLIFQGDIEQQYREAIEAAKALLARGEKQPDFHESIDIDRVKESARDGFTHMAVSHRCLLELLARGEQTALTKQHIMFLRNELYASISCGAEDPLFQECYEALGSLLKKFVQPAAAEKCRLCNVDFYMTRHSHAEKSQPFCWVIPGSDTADVNGFIDARVDRLGEFTKPLYVEPAAAENARDPTHVAIIELHETTKRKAVIVPTDQSLDFDEGDATRRWLWPYLGTDHHLVEFVEITSPPAATGDEK